MILRSVLGSAVNLSGWEGDFRDAQHQEIGQPDHGVIIGSVKYRLYDPETG